MFRLRLSPVIGTRTCVSSQLPCVMGLIQRQTAEWSLSCAVSRYWHCCFLILTLNARLHSFQVISRGFRTIAQIAFFSSVTSSERFSHLPAKQRIASHMCMYFDTVQRFFQLKIRCHRAFCAYFLQITDLSSGIDGRALLIVAGFSIRHSHKSLGRTYTMIFGAFLVFVEVRRITARLLEDPSSVS